MYERLMYGFIWDAWRRSVFFIFYIFITSAVSEDRISGGLNSPITEHTCTSRTALYYGNFRDEQNYTKLPDECNQCCCASDTNQIDCSGLNSENLDYLISARSAGSSNYTHFYMNENKLDTLSHFAMLENLDLILALDLSGNALKSLTLSELEIFDNLRYLKLAQNEIGRIYRTRHPIKNLEHLDLSENNIMTITNTTFDGLSTLKKLDLSGNLLTALAAAFTRMPQLMHLKIQNNQLQSLQAEHFVGLRQMMELDLAGNRIKTLDGPKFTYTPNLKILRLQNNQMAFISSDAFDGLTSLELLDISSNWLGNIHPDTFTPLPAGMKEQIILNENPLMCDCEIRHLVSWVSRWPKRVLNGKNLRCSHVPGEAGKNAGKRLMELKSHDLCDWLAELRNMIIVPMAILLTIMLSIVLTCLFRRKSSNGSQATMSTIYQSNFYDIDSIGTGSSQNGGMVSDNTQCTTVPFQYPRNIQLPASLVPVHSPKKEMPRKVKQLERLKTIKDDFTNQKSEVKSQLSYDARSQYSDDSHSRSSYYSSDRDSEYDRTSMSYSEDGI